MTVIASHPAHSPVRQAAPSARRLVGAAIVASVGVIALSVAVGGSVAASRFALPAETAADAHALVGRVPAIVAIGLVHLLVAAAMLSRRELVRLIAVAATGLVAIAVAAASAMTAAGVDPFGGAAGAHASGTGVGMLALAAVLYGAAALFVGTAPEEG
jgi:hypothetical protein